MYAFLVLLVLAVPVAVIVSLALVLAARRDLRRLEREIDDLRRRVDQAGRVPEISATPAAPARPSPRPPEAAAAPPAPAHPAEAFRPAPVSIGTEAPVAVGTGEPEETPPPPAAVEEAARSGPAPARGLEERFGTRWVVWAGGVALVLGGVFLVQYSIEQGLIGPGVRIFLGALLSLGLLAGGEYTRRYATRTKVPGVPTADIPSILTAAGTTVAFVTVYGAYALYGFLDPAVAFFLLAVVALGTLAAALVHGPWLAALGLVGAFVTPALVAAEAPNYWALAVYVLVVTAATLALARIRHWRWLALAGIVLGALWMLPGIDDVGALPAHVFHVSVGFVVVATFIVSGFLFGPEIAPGRIEIESSGALGAYPVMAALLVVATGFDTSAVAAFVVLAGATILVAGRTEAATGAVPAAAILSLILVASGFGDFGAPPGGGDRQLLVFGAGVAVLFALAGYAAQAGATSTAVAIVWSSTAAVAPVAIVVGLYYHIAGLALSLPFAVAALVMAVLYATATERLIRRAPRPGSATATALFASAAIASLALALTFGLEGGWLSVGLALMVPGIAWVGTLRPLPALRWLVAALVAVVVGRVAFEPRIVADLGATPVFNWLLYGYGVPAVSFWIAGTLLRRRADDIPARIVEAAAILFTVLLLLVEIRHFVNGGDIYRASAGLAESALQVVALLAVAIALERVRCRTRSIVQDVGGLAVAALALAGVVLFLVVRNNPWWTPVDVGGVVFNLIMLGYLLPALMIVVLAWITRATRPAWYHAVAIATATGLGLLYLLLETARLFRGPVLALGPITNGEQYAYSAVTLAYGVVLLLAGIVSRSQVIRFASAAVVLIATGKVFLVDLAGLSGPFRALSFIGLGLALVGIGWLYQRLLFPRPPERR